MKAPYTLSIYEVFSFWHCSLGLHLTLYMPLSVDCIWGFPLEQRQGIAQSTSRAAPAGAWSGLNQLGFWVIILQMVVCLDVNR